MLNNDKLQLDLVWQSLDKNIEEIKAILLTKEVLDEDKLNALYQDLIKLSSILEGEKELPRKITNSLFQFYLITEAEMAYINPQDGPLQFFIPYLQKYIGKIFVDE